MESSEAKGVVELDLPEHGSVVLPLAGMGGRLVASLIDHALLGVGYLSLLVMAGVMVGSDALYGEFAMPAVVGISLVVPLGGPLVLELLGHGQSPGKAVLHLRVLSADGSRASAGQLLLRNVARLVDFLPLLYFVGMMVIFATRHGQRLGDLVAGTLVVREDDDALRDLTGPAEAPTVATALHGVPSAVLHSARLLFEPGRQLDAEVLDSRAAELVALVRRFRPDLASQSDEAICRQLRSAVQPELERDR